AQAVALDGFGQDDGGAAGGFDRSFESGINFFRIVPAAAQLGEFFVGHILYESGELRILAKELLANVTAGRDDIFLIFAVNDFTHAAHQQAAFIFFEQGIPIVAPDDFDDVPASAAEKGF